MLTTRQLTAGEMSPPAKSPLKNRQSPYLIVVITCIRETGRQASLYCPAMNENPGDNNPHRTAKAEAKAAQAYAKATRPWFKKKRWWAAGVVLVAVAASIGGGAGSDDAVADETKSAASGGKSDSSSSGTKKEQAAKEPAVKPMNVQAAAILKEFEGNEAAADLKYEGKVLRVTGEVSKVDTELLDDSEYVIQVNGGGDFDFFSVNCNDQAPEDVAKIQIGQQITVVGQFDDGGDLGVELKDCNAA